MKLKRYEIRISVTKNLYDCISQEAKNRDTKIAAVAKEKLAKYFIRPEKHTDLQQISNNSNENQGNNIILDKLVKTEKRLSFAVSRIESLIIFSQEHIKLVVEMLDQFYFDLMKYLPEIPTPLAEVASITAKLRHQQWLETIKNNMADFENE